MPIGWLAVLQSVPWSEVIKNAPKVADGAKKLWNAVANKSAPLDPPFATAKTASSPELQTIAALQANVAVMASALSDLQGQMLASSELIKELAEQNTQLITRVEANRARVRWLALVAVLTTVTSVIAMVLAAGGGMV